MFKNYLKIAWRNLLKKIQAIQLLISQGFQWVWRWLYSLACRSMMKYLSIAIIKAIPGLDRFSPVRPLIINMKLMRQL